MLAMQGNTAPYLQYAVARIHSIFRKAEDRPLEHSSDFIFPNDRIRKKACEKASIFPYRAKANNQRTKTPFPRWLSIRIGN